MDSRNMPHGARSPAASENGFDLAAALFDGPDHGDNEAAGGKQMSIPDGDGTNLDIDALAPLPADDGADSGDDGAFINAALASSNRKTTNLYGKTVKKGGGFQAMGLNALLLKAISRKGFSVPTPIQRKTIPLVLDGQDVVGMARTGSGKTAAFVIPMLERLKGHSAKVGARGVIMSPSRELALQTLKVVKELGRGTNLRTVLLVGGDSLEDQFAAMTSTNPDIVIATPGRFLHLMVEMKLDLSSVQYVVFDEADRLFEMGFAAQLGEILAALPASRQTLLFSATLPSSLVEFARAGLQEPKLVRLDAESKVSPDLRSAFFAVKSAEKEGALLHVLRHVIQMPLGDTEAARNLAQRKRDAANATKSKKRKRGEDAAPSAGDSPTPHSTIVFAATKHHVEFLASLLGVAGYSVSYVYGSLDQTARKQQVQDFRSGLTNILVVTDVAARGIDIPVLANVVNFDFPSQPKIFVHRVGRTARAGKTGWSYSLVRDADLPYLLDLQLFLGRRLVLGRVDAQPSFTEDVVVGTLPRNRLEQACEAVAKLLNDDGDLDALRIVATKGEKLYNRTRNSASYESAKRAKEVVSSSKWGELHALFAGDAAEEDVEREREDFLKRVSGFRPQETVFEIGKRGKSDVLAEIVKARRLKIVAKKQKSRHEDVDANADGAAGANGSAARDRDANESDDSDVAELDPFAGDDDDDVEVTISQPRTKRSRPDANGGTWQDAEHFMSYLPANNTMAAERGYGIASGSNEKSAGSASFLTAARNATMNLDRDEAAGNAEASKMRWDKRHKKYVARANDDDGSKGRKIIRGESGLKIAASLRGGRFDAWKKANKVRQPRLGEAEAAGGGGGGSGPGSSTFGTRFRHKADKAPKEADKFRDDYHKQKKKVAEAKEKRIGKFKDGAGAKNELRSAVDVRKMRKEKERRREKNARLPRKKKF